MAFDVGDLVASIQLDVSNLQSNLDRAGASFAQIGTKLDSLNSSTERMETGFSRMGTAMGEVRDDMLTYSVAIESAINKLPAAFERVGVSSQQGLRLMDEAMNAAKATAFTLNTTISGSLAEISNKTTSATGNITRQFNNQNKVIQDSARLQKEAIESMTSSINQLIASTERSSKALLNMASSAQSSKGAWDSFSSGMLGSLRQMTTNIFFVQMAIQQLSSMFTTAFGQGIKFAVDMENSLVGLGAIISSSMLADGAPISFAQGMNIAQDSLEQLRKAALTSTLSLDELMGTFQGILGPATAAGMSLKEALDFTVFGATAVKSLGLKKDQLIQELRSILTENITARSSTVAIALGITNQDIENAKSQVGGVFAFLQERMAGFAEASKYSAGTFTALWTNIQDGIQQSQEKAFTGLFANIKKELAEIQNIFFTVKTAQEDMSFEGKLFKKGEVYSAELNPTTVVAFKELADIVSGIYYDIKNWATALTENDSVVTKVEAAFNAIYIVINAVYDNFGKIATALLVWELTTGSILTAFTSIAIYSGQISNIMDLVTNNLNIIIPLMLVWKDLSTTIATISATSAVTMGSILSLVLTISSAFAVWAILSNDSSMAVSDIFEKYTLVSSALIGIVAVLTTIVALEKLHAVYLAVTSLATAEVVGGVTAMSVAMAVYNEAVTIATTLSAMFGTAWEAAGIAGVIETIYALVTSLWMEAGAATGAALATNLFSIALKRLLIGTVIGAIIVGIGYALEKLAEKYIMSGNAAENAAAQIRDHTSALLENAQAEMAVTNARSLLSAKGYSEQELARMSADELEEAAEEEKHKKVFVPTITQKYPAGAGGVGIDNSAAKAEREELKSQMEAIDGLLKAKNDEIKYQLDELKYRYQQNAVSIAEYYETMQSLTTDSIQNEVDAIQQKIAIETDVSNQEKLSQQLKLKTQQLDRDSIKVIRERTEAFKKLNSEIVKYTVTDLKNQGQYATATQLEYNDSIKDTVEKLKINVAWYQAKIDKGIALNEEETKLYNGLQLSLKVIEQTGQAKVELAKVEEIELQKKKEDVEYNAKKLTLDKKLADNALNEYTYKEELRKLNNSLADSYEDVVKRLQDEIDMGKLSATDVVNQQQKISDLKEKIISLRDPLTQMQKLIKDSLQTEMSAMFVDIIKGTESVASAFKKMVSNVLTEMLKLEANKTTASILQNLLGKWFPRSTKGKGTTTSSGGSSLLSGAITSLSGVTGLKYRSTGGSIYGAGTSTSDSIPLMASNGEYMIRAAAVAKLGKRALDYINVNGKLPPLGYASGGLVSYGTSSSSLSSANSSPTNIKVNLYNQTGTSMQATAKQSFNGVETVMELWLTGLSNNVMDSKNVVKNIR